MRYPKVIDVKPVEDYNVIITYETGEKKKFDVTPYIKGNWFGELKDIEIFKAVRPCGSTIEWRNGQDIAPHELFELSVAVR
ncbi:MAG: DUF2442 domain-containing protein [Monoglobales bacterium]